MKHGEYVLFTFNNKRWRGRISIENDVINLFQDIHNGGTCTEQFGHESGWPIVSVGNKEGFNNYVKTYVITVVSKAGWTKHKDPVINSTLGWQFSKSKGKNPTYTFGCGAVKLNRKQILEFADVRDEYVRMHNKRAEVQAKLQVKIRAEDDKINEWLKEHAGAREVIEVLRTRNVDVKRTNPERLKRLFG